MFPLIDGKEELQDPQGKFALPEDEDAAKEGENDVITLEKSMLLELQKVKAM